MPRLQISYESRPVISRSAKTIRSPRGRSISAMARISDDLSARWRRRWRQSRIWKFSGKHRQALGRRRNTGRDLLLRAELSCLFVHKVIYSNANGEPILPCHIDRTEGIRFFAFARDDDSTPKH